MHIAAVLAGDRTLRLYVNSEEAGKGEAADFILGRPNEGALIGADEGTLVGPYTKPCPWKGLIDEVRVYYGELDQNELGRWGATRESNKRD